MNTVIRADELKPGQRVGKREVKTVEVVISYTWVDFTDGTNWVYRNEDKVTIREGQGVK